MASGDLASPGGSEQRELHDPWYLFTTMEPSVAAFWRRADLRGTGIIVDVRVPEGPPAAYLDAEDVLPDRGYGEFVFGRGSRVRPTGAYLDAAGIKHLEVELLPRASLN